MKIRRLICAIATIGITTVNANCNPLKETCDPIPGITSPLRTDFTKLSTDEDARKNGWTIANHATFRTDSKDGGVFPIEKRFDAPYIWTTGYFLYGHVDVLMQAAPGAGVISSAVLMSDTADEVDWEWSGNNYWEKSPMVQTNYFGKGITGSYDRSTMVTPGFEMTTELHKYSIDWTAESLTWSIDDEVVRTLYKKDCDDGEHQYPQTPSRFHLGVWVAGDPGNAAGVIQWSGGETDFTKLPYIAYVKSMNLEPASKCAYFNYTDKRGSSDSVKCLSELPQSLSSVVSSTALLNTLSAAPPAPPTASNTVSTSGVGSSSSSTTNSASSRSTQTSEASSSSIRSTGGTTSTNSASSRSTQAIGSSGSVQLTTSTVYRTTVFATVTSCNTTVTNCPANKPLTSTVLVTDVVVDYTTVCPVTEIEDQSSTRKSPSTGSESEPASSAAQGQTGLRLAPASSSMDPSSTSKGPLSPSSQGSTGPSLSKSALSLTDPVQTSSTVNLKKIPATQRSSGSASSQVSASSYDEPGTATGSQRKQDAALSGNSATDSTEPPALTTSTVYSTNIYTVTSCGPGVTSCPASSTVLSTEVVVAYTTICPVSSDSPAPSSVSQGLSSGSPSEDRPSDNAPTQSRSSLTYIPPKYGLQIESSQTASPGNPSAPQSTDSAPPQSQSSLTVIAPEDDSRGRSSQTASSGSPSAPATDHNSAPPASSTIKPPKNGSQNQLSQTTSSDDHSVDASSDAPASPSSSTIIPPDDHVATTSIQYGQSSPSLYNTDTEVKASGTTTLPAALPTGKKGDAPPVAANHADPGSDISQSAGEHESEAPPAEKGHTPEGGPPPGARPSPEGPAPAPEPAGDSHSSTGLAHPVPADESSHVASITRSTITRTTTVRLTYTRQSTSTFYSASSTVITSCAAGQSGADCSTISSTTTFVVSKLVTPVPYTTMDVLATTETVDVALADSSLSSAAAQGASGVAGAGTGTGHQPAGAKTSTLAKVAGAGRAFEAVPGVFVALAIAVFFL